jgi:hypothetical protein
MERGGKVGYRTEPVDDSRDRKIIDHVLDRFEEFDSFKVDATKAKKFVEEKRHKIKRFPKKPTKVYEDKKDIIPTNNKFKDRVEEVVTTKKSTSKKPTKIIDDVDSEEVVATPKKFTPKKPTKVEVESENEDEDEVVKTNKPIPKKPTKIKDNTIEVVKEEKTLSKIQLLNQELFKENSNKSRNEEIKSAWKSLQEYELPNKDNLTIKKSHPGHFITMGCNSGSLRNPHWLVIDKKTNEEYYIMYCETDGYTKFSVEDYKDVINPEDNRYPTWHIEKIGYIQTKNYITRTAVYLHQVICKKYNEKKYSTLSVDHKNRDKLDNRKENLRFATQSEQNQNTDKRNRKYNAKKLPEGLKQEDMPKYVLYYSEMYGTNKDKFREWLNIEKHPKQNGKRWSSSKSMSITIQEKLEQAKAKLEELDL